MTTPSASGERVDRWPDRLGRVVEASDGRLRRVVVLAETGSTQDAARRANAVVGDVFTAARQTRGRGRYGRKWADTGGDGVAVTYAAPRDAPARLAIATAVGVARAVERFLAAGRDAAVGIKWPNDVLVAGRKIAGILVEQTDDCALIGIGVNVRQTDWPDTLAARAVSLRQLGADLPRIDVLERLLAEVPPALEMPDDALLAAFAARDVLTGTTGRFRCGERVVQGRVVRIDPVGGIAVADAEGEVVLEAATWVREAD